MLTVRPARFIVAAVLMAALATSTDAAAQVTIESMSIGLDGLARPGVWTRVRSTIAADSPIEVRVELLSTDPDGNPVHYPGPSLQLEAGAAQTADVFFKPGRLETSVTLQIIDSETDAVVASRKRTSKGEESDSGFRVVPNATSAWIIVGQLPGSPGLAANPDRDAISKLRDRGVHLTELAGPDELPTQVQTLSAWQVAIVSSEFHFPQPQSDALKSWVRNGGHLILAIGRSSDELLDGPLAEWALDGQKINVGTISDLSGLELLVTDYADRQGGSVPLEDRRIPFFNPRPGVTISQTNGSILAEGLDGPVLTRHACGFGRITLLGIDLNQPPLSRWRGLDAFIVSVAAVPIGGNSDNQGPTRISHTGITELATQLQNGMEQFEAVGERSTLGLLGLTLFYLLLIGPIDWFVVHRILKRPGLTWFTFPAAVLIAGLLAGMAARGANGSELRVNTLEVVDIDATSGYGRQTVWSSIFSPSNRRALVAQSSTQLFGNAGAMWLSWSGIPESYFGGMYRTSGLEFGRPGYRLAGGASGYAGIDNLPVPIWSDRVLVSDQEFTPDDGYFSSDLQRAGSGRLTPESSFSHNLPVPIREWLIVDKSHIYYPRPDGGDILEAGSLVPGEKWTPLNDSIGVQALRGFLTGSRFQRIVSGKGRSVGDEYMTTQVAWDSSNTDMASVIRMMTLHSMSGGADYTGLTNAMFPHLEFSDSLQLDRVILLGRVDMPATELRIDDEPVKSDRHETIVRILLPVQDLGLGDLPDLEK